MRLSLRSRFLILPFPLLLLRRSLLRMLLPTGCFVVVLPLTVSAGAFATLGLCLRRSRNAVGSLVSLGVGTTNSLFSKCLLHDVGNLDVRSRLAKKHCADDLLVRFRELRHEHVGLDVVFELQSTILNFFDAKKEFVELVRNRLRIRHARTVDKDREVRECRCRINSTASFLQVLPHGMRG